MSRSMLGKKKGFFISAKSRLSQQVSKSESSISLFRNELLFDQAVSGVHNSLLELMRFY